VTLELKPTRLLVARSWRKVGEGLNQMLAVSAKRLKSLASLERTISPVPRPALKKYY